MTQNDGRVKIEAPLGVAQVLLHCCCAPCAGEIVEALLDSGIIPTLFFYNPNIYPRNEYELRKKAVKDFADKKDVAFVDGDYDDAVWAEATAGFENEEEGGIRCEKCFFMRLSRSAQYAKENDFKIFTSTLGISRYKNFEKVSECGHLAAKKHGIIYWDHNWRKKGGSQRMYEIAKQEKFYAQNYCGCKFSLKSRNKQEESILK
ncbi:MAG: epoxyqueuosine reductase QueH [Candidatus Aceula meridiana]|nr:epoxyqueuosine reductase QueH [Candidatus Aceula meridiana]